MYVPKHFEETRIEVLRQFIREQPLGTLVTLTPHGLDANHLPFEIDPQPSPLGTLRGHIARANPLWRDSSPGTEALVVFQNSGTYISPSWYPSKQETGKVVPTWNYAVVHAHGTLRLVDDPEWLRTFVTQLTNRYEAGRSKPWRVTDAPAEFIDKQLGAIIGVEIQLARLIGKWKVSQNRPAPDRDGVIDGLLAEKHDAARAMAEFVRQVRDE